MRNHAWCWSFFLFMPNPKLILGGKRWTYERPRSITLDGHPCHGICDSETRTIKVEKSLTGLPELETTLHEMDHATGDFLDEEFVTVSAKEKATALWQLGWRRLSPADAKALDKSRDG